MYNDENPTNRITHNIVLKNMLDKMPVVDSHMHIQGNDIAPIPIMKGILLYRIANALCDKDINQINIKQISYQSSSSIDDKDYDKRNDFISNILSINMLDIDSYLMENRTSMEDLLAKEDFSIVKEGIRKEIDNNYKKEEGSRPPYFLFALNYKMIYDNCLTLKSSFEPIYMYLCIICKFLSFSYLQFRMVIATIIVLFIFLAMRKYEKRDNYRK